MPQRLDGAFFILFGLEDLACYVIFKGIKTIKHGQKGTNAYLSNGGRLHF